MHIFVIDNRVSGKLEFCEEILHLAREASMCQNRTTSSFYQTYNSEQKHYYSDWLLKVELTVYYCCNELQFHCYW